MPSYIGLPNQAELEALTPETQLFFIVAYFFILFRSAELIGDASEKLLMLYGPGIVGGLVIPILGSVPEGAIVLFSGVGKCAQSSLNVGIGTLAGSSIMLLTIPFSLSMFLGYRDLDENTGKAAKDRKTNKPKFENGFTMTKSVVTVFPANIDAAKVMMLTGLSFWFTFLPAILFRNAKHEGRDQHWPALGGILACSLGFIGYSIWQIRDAAHEENLKMKQHQIEVKEWQKKVSRAFGDRDNAIRIVFDRMDKDKNGYVDRQELQNGLRAMGLETDRRGVFDIMEQMNSDNEFDDGVRESLNFDEFKYAVKRWSHLPTVRAADQKSIHSKIHESTPLLLEDIKIAEDNDDDEEISIPTRRESIQGESTKTAEKRKMKLQNSLFIVDGVWQYEESVSDDEEYELDQSDDELLWWAIFYLIVGGTITILFSDPMIDAIQAFSKSIHVNSFFVSFFLTPLAGNISEIYAALLFARKKTTEGISLSLVSLYGAATMNNTFVLGVFCILIFLQNLAFTFITETMVILVTMYTVGLLSLKTTFPMWQGFVILALFPASIIIVATLQGTINGPTIIVPGCPTS